MKLVEEEDLSEIFDSLVIHYGNEKARFCVSALKVHQSVITLPTAWRLKPFVEVSLDFQIPAQSKKRSQLIKCRAIILDCRSLRKKGHFHTDFFITYIPARHAAAFQQLIANNGKITAD